MAGLCEGGNKPPGSLNANPKRLMQKPSGCKLVELCKKWERGQMSRHLPGSCFVCFAGTQGTEQSNRSIRAMDDRLEFESDWECSVEI
ncbi:hypothetical protein ANN_18045 [Periplaneta americana]|uniref:Uncharacterized protein n=1 Tax=Periplaneta americana TaxID=6978 RepID=A0ABQ8SMP4_PERAM|nr:hypothetical protein ANN_18045 [Periplaneta americana]